MPVSPSYRAYVLEQLRGTASIVAKSMFGGVGLYRGGFFFGLIADDCLYFKVDDSNRADYQAAGSAAFRPYGEDSYTMQYYEVPADVLDDRGLLGEWATKAVAVARQSATARRKRRRE
jgi:DNA transformation protein